jgi:hypothetical protein
VKNQFKWWCSKRKCVKCDVSVVNREASVEVYSAQIQIYPLHIEINLGGKLLVFSVKNDGKNVFSVSEWS